MLDKVYVLDPTYQKVVREKLDAYGDLQFLTAVCAAFEQRAEAIRMLAASARREREMTR